MLLLLSLLAAAAQLSHAQRPGPAPPNAAVVAVEALNREQQIGGSGGSLEPLGLFLNPLGLFLRTSIPFIWRILSAFLRA